MNLRVAGAIGAVVVVLALLAGASAWLRDEPASAEVRQWLQQVPAGQGESRAYRYLNGLDAPAGQPPEELGASRLEEYERWLAGRGVGADGFVVRPVASLPLPDVPLLCRIEAAGCFQALLAQADQLPALNAAYRLLRERYWQFLGMEDYRTLTSVSLAEPVPPLTYLHRGQQLLHLHWLQQALEGGGPASQAALQEELGGLRQHLRQADSLILKMLLSVLVNRNLEWQARLYRHDLTPRPVVPAPFSVAERSLLRPMQREFFGIAQLYAQLPDRVSGWESLNLLLWFRPQMTINASLASYAQAAELSQRAPVELVAALESAPPGPSPLGGLRNRVGNILLDIGGPDLRLYAGRLHDLEAKRRLLVALVQLPPGPVEAASVARLPGVDNPYYPGRPAEPDGKGQLCFAGPLEAHVNGRCLPW